MYSGKIAVPPGGGGFREFYLFIFSVTIKRIKIKFTI
jgi:hypothetical protein